ncbi:hypothetical protein [Kribbella solani]|uniref:Uncharacterized protein n=1 Tax=Kribbella solani TaxID=236067 RepID=A0A841DZE0_9ACTN|nr:hypothetical protein [Kribbella solani]MBB5982130.1 hypothetical protein [Kribbella solani]
MTTAREFLRAELIALAEIVVPGQQPIVTHDPGPVNPGVLFDGRGPATVCRITVQTGNPTSPAPTTASPTAPTTDPTTDRATGPTTDPAAAASAAVTAAADALRARGWTVDLQPPENGHYRLSAKRDGYDLAVHAWSTDWRITFTGETPLVS